MTTVCPICNSSAQALPAGDATAIGCPTHGDFKVAKIVFAEAKAKGYTPNKWEAALNNAEQRVEGDEWPLIIVDDFY